MFFWPKKSARNKSQHVETKPTYRPRRGNGKPSVDEPILGPVLICTTPEHLRGGRRRGMRGRYNSSQNGR